MTHELLLLDNFLIIFTKYYQPNSKNVAFLSDLIRFHTYSYVTFMQWGGNIWSPADFVRFTFAHWQRNDQSIILMVGLFGQWETE